MPKRTDANQAEIVAALRQAGATVQTLHEVGHGCPDLLVGYLGDAGGGNYLFEVKTRTGRLTPAEAEWIRNWRGQVRIVYCAEDALRAIGAIL